MKKIDLDNIALSILELGHHNSGELALNSIENKSCVVNGEVEVIKKYFEYIMNYKQVTIPDLRGSLDACREFREQLITSIYFSFKSHFADKHNMQLFQEYIDGKINNIVLVNDEINNEIFLEGIHKDSYTKLRSLLALFSADSRYFYKVKVIIDIRKDKEAKKYIN